MATFLHSRVLAIAAGVGLLSCTGTILEPREDEAEVVVQPATPTLKRLTRAQYANAIHDIVGSDIVVPIALEPDVEEEGFFAVGASSATVSARGVEQYEAAAFDIAEQAMEPGPIRNGLMPCEPAGTVDADCSAAFVRDFGKEAWRRPLSDDEVRRYSLVADDAAGKLGDFYDGLEFAMAGLLQSPNFVFRVELGEPDPTKPDARRYTSLEMASRLSFVLWNTTPDAALLDAGERGDLVDPAVVEAQVERMLASPRAKEGVRNFFEELWQLHDLDQLNKDGEKFKSMSADLGAYAREETLMGIEYLVFDLDGDYRDIFTTRRTFVNRKLASLYGIPAPKLEGFAMTQLPKDGPRAGLLGQASVLALHAHPVSTSATLRGKFVRTTLLCGVIPPPPADVDTALPESTGNNPTLRDRIQEHLTNPACASCHNTMDPIGLGLEEFDGIGKYRPRENGVPIDASGEVDGIPFSNGVELGRAIAKHPDVGSCLVRQFYRYSVGEKEGPGQDAELARLTEVFEESGYRIKSLIAAMLMSDAFRATREAE